MTCHGYGAANFRSLTMWMPQLTSVFFGVILTLMTAFPVSFSVVYIAMWEHRMIDTRAALMAAPLFLVRDLAPARNARAP